MRQPILIQASTYLWLSLCMPSVRVFFTLPISFRKSTSLGTRGKTLIHVSMSHGSWTCHRILNRDILGLDTDRQELENIQSANRIWLYVWACLVQWYFSFLPPFPWTSHIHQRKDKKVSSKTKTNIVFTCLIGILSSLSWNYQYRWLYPLFCNRLLA